MDDLDYLEWGASSRFYAEKPRLWPFSPYIREEPDALAQRWEAELEAASRGIREEVEKAARFWNQTIREHIRTETGLRLASGEQRRGVPVRVVSEIPLPVRRVFEISAEWSRLILNRPKLLKAIEGTEFMRTHFSAADRLVGDRGLSSPDEIAKVEETARRWLEKLDEFMKQTELVQSILGQSIDVLGAYFFRLPEVRLYWVVIGTVALLIGVSVEALTIVVLTHELAHAYTHLGIDIDGVSWDTEAFAKTDIFIVEGLAQFYTWLVCRRLEPREGSASTAYKALLAYQAAPYKVHEEWVQNDAKPAEIIRASMIECRSKHLLRHPDFRNALDRYRQALRGRSPIISVDR